MPCLLYRASQQFGPEDRGIDELPLSLRAGHTDYTTVETLARANTAWDKARLFDLTSGLLTALAASERAASGKKLNAVGGEVSYCSPKVNHDVLAMN
jgi:hypothetical protein